MSVICPKKVEIRLERWPPIPPVIFRLMEVFLLPKKAFSLDLFQIQAIRDQYVKMCYIIN